MTFLFTSIMPRGKWSFLHEWVVYEYLMARFYEKTLRLKIKVKSGQLQLREKWKKVTNLKPITGTRFPDVESITFSGSNAEVPAEVKFTTSLFNYHLKDATQFEPFTNMNGVIIVLSHDYVPAGLKNRNIDVYEIDQIDFVAFCRENFVRLLNRQIRRHTETKVWIMYQGPNFNQEGAGIRPARESGIWCPTENLSGFDLAEGDRVLFVKTLGSSTQDVQSAYLKNRIPKNWLLEEVYVGELTSTIYSRSEYCTIRGIPQTEKLWLKDNIRNNDWRWNRVFEFEKVSVLRPKIQIRRLSENQKLMNLVLAVTESFCYNRSREITLEEYRDFLEYITQYQMRVEIYGK